MTTDIMTLREYGELCIEVAEDWDGDEPAVLVGDIASENLNITAKDGHSTFGMVGYAHECFEDNGVHTLSKGDTRFFGTMLMRQDELAEEVQEALEDSGGDE